MSGSGLPPRVFVAYSHDTSIHQTRVQELAERLRHDGIDARLDVYAPDQEARGRGWLRWIQEQLAEADFIAIVCTERLRERFEGAPSTVGNHGRTWEALLATQLLHDGPGRISKVVPVLFERASDAAVPTVLRGEATYRAVSEYRQLCAHLLADSGSESALVSAPRESLDPIAPRSAGLPDTLVAVQELPSPLFKSGASQALSTMLQQASLRKHQLERAGLDTAEVDHEIEVLKGLLRLDGSLTAGDVLEQGRYLLLTRLGHNRVSTVWKVLDYWTLDIVALKVLHPETAGDPIRRERFFRSARMMAKLDHPAVVKVLEPYGEDRGYCFFTMELLGGGSLRRAVRSGRITGEDGAITTLMRIGGALASAHERGYVHRDVKPSNILLNAREEVQLTDFDLATFERALGNTHNAPLDELLYIAPELYQKPRESDARADVYGLAMTAIFVLHGDRIPRSIVRDPGRFIEGLACRPALRRVLARAIDDDPKQRFEHAAALCGAVRSVVQVSEQTREQDTGYPYPVLERNEAQKYLDLRGGGRRSFVSRAASAAIVRRIAAPPDAPAMAGDINDTIPDPPLINWPDAGRFDTPTPYVGLSFALGFELSPVMKKFGSYYPERVTIGRDSECDLAIFHETVSWRHGYFTHRESRWCVHDDGSTNGTYVRGIRVRIGHPEPLQSGDTVRFGDIEFHFYQPPELYRALRSFAGERERATPDSGTFPPVTVARDQEQAVIRLLEACSSMRTQNLRDELRQRLPPIMHSRLDGSGTLREQASALVRCCRDYGAFADLCQAVHWLENDTVHYRRLTTHLREIGLLSGG